MVATDIRTQRIKILDELRKGADVPAYVFAMKLGVLQYNARVKELREQGHRIENIYLGHTGEGKRQTAFRLIEGDSQ